MERTSEWTDTGKTFGKDRLLQGMLAVYAVFWALMAVKPYSWYNWWLENLLVILSLAVLSATFRRYRFNNVSYGMIIAFIALHTFGAHYSYNTTPIDRLMHHWFSLDRDNFDRVVHFSFGLFIVYPTWEFGVRILGLKRGWSRLAAPVFILAFGAFYELIEMWVAFIVAPEIGTMFLGTQGDVWDSQHDMEVALYGAVLTMAGLALRDWFKRL